LFISNELLIIFLSCFSANIGAYITCTTMSLVCTMPSCWLNELYIRLNLQLIVICNLLLFGISNILFFFCVQHLITDNSHILLVIVFCTIFRDTFDKITFGFLGVPAPRLFFC